VLPAIGQTWFVHAITAFAGLVASPLALPSHQGESVAIEASQPPESPDGEAPSAACLAATICEVKDRVRWRTRAWTPQFCRTIADAVLASAKKYDVPPSLILAVMINESDMNERAFRPTMKNGKLYARDGGLMGIRCIVDKRNRCVNGNVRGVSWADVMDPVKNIDIGAHELGHWAHGGGVIRKTVRTRDRQGVLHTRQRQVPCTHRTHAYWAHYNHGPRYIDRGPARHYPHRVAVLYYALARAMSIDTSDLTSMHLTVDDPGKRRRTADRPVEPRYRKLCQTIRDLGPVCRERSTAQLKQDPVGAN
jgi:hypothetical protein